MALSYNEYNGDGVQRDFPISFGYINVSHVRAEVDGVLVNLSFQTPSLVRLAQIPAAGTKVRVYRQTPNTALIVNFEPGSTLTSEDVSLAFLQDLYLVQEAVDAAGLSIATANLQELYARNAAWFYDVVVSCPFVPATNETILTMPIVRPLQLPQNALGSRAWAETAPPAAYTFNILRNGSVVGTVSFPLGAQQGVWSVAAPVNFAVGDRLSLRLVGSVAIGWRDFGFTLKLLKVLS